MNQPLRNPSHGMVAVRKKKSTPASTQNDPILKDTRTWLSELRDACEMNFDAPEEARRRIRHMQVEWKEAMDRGDMTPALLRRVGRTSLPSVELHRPGMDRLARRFEILESRLETRSRR